MLLFEDIEDSILKQWHKSNIIKWRIIKMKKLEKRIMVEILGGIEFFTTLYTMPEIKKMKCRYVGTDFETNYNIYEINNTGELILAES